MDISTSTEQAKDVARANGRPARLPHDDALAAQGGRVAERLAWRGRHHRPVATATVVGILGVLLMAGIIVGLGLLLTHVLLAGGLGGWDERVSDWFVTQRTSAFNGITAMGTTIGSTGAVVAVAAAAVILLTVKRLWREVGLIVVALSVEVVVFLTTTVIVNRPRPTVPRLDPSPPTSSFPSGHTAAAIALWISLAIVISMHVKNAAVRALVWIVALGLPVFVGISRLYRGMHHPTDVIASVILGAGAIAVALLAVRSASGVDDIRHSPQIETDPVPADGNPARVAS